MDTAGWEWSEFARVLRDAAARPPHTLHVLGRPGGLLRLHGGRVVDGWSVGTPLSVPPQAPAARAVAGSTTGSPSTVRAIADILFTMAAGRVHGVREEPGPPAAAAGVDVEYLLREVSRRLASMASAAGGRPLSPDARPVRTRFDPKPNMVLSDDERAVLGFVGGTTTVREIAFLLGRGLYAVSWDVSHLIDVGLVEIAAAARPSPTRRSVDAPRSPGRTSVVGEGQLFRALWAVPERMVRSPPGADGTPRPVRGRGEAQAR